MPSFWYIVNYDTITHWTGINRKRMSHHRKINSQIMWWLNYGWERNESRCDFVAHKSKFQNENYLGMKAYHCQKLATKPRLLHRNSINNQHTKLSSIFADCEISLKMKNSENPFSINFNFNGHRSHNGILILPGKQLFKQLRQYAFQVL